MEEVREIAERALKEVREVVRGRRAIYLDAELAGLQSVLRAAAVACEVTGTGAEPPESVQAALAWVVREAPRTSFATAMRRAASSTFGSQPVTSRSPWRTTEWPCGDGRRAARGWSASANGSGRPAAHSMARTYPMAATG